MRWILYASIWKIGKTSDSLYFAFREKQTPINFGLIKDPGHWVTLRISKNSHGSNGVADRQSRRSSIEYGAPQYKGLLTLGKMEPCYIEILTNRYVAHNFAALNFWLKEITMSSTSDVTELLSKMKSYSERVKPLLEHCDTEEQTKISFINPFIEVLDHDVRDPRQVRFEYSVDVRLNKEKVDYAIFHEGHPTIFVEAKAVGADLTSGRHLEQVRSYANQTHSVKFVALTNGVDWHWFKKDHRQFDGYGLEEKPFLTHNILKPGPQELSFLIKVCGRGMDVKSAEEQALETRLLTAFEDWLRKQLKEESLDDDLIALLTRKYVGKAQQKNLDKTRRLWTISIKRFIEKRIEERLQMAQNSETSQSTVNLHEVDEANIETKVNRDNEATGTTPSVSTREFATDSGIIVLQSNQRARAWRPKEDSTWRIEKNGNDLFINVLRFLASRHDFGPLAYFQSISESHGKLISNDQMVYAQYRNAAHVGNGYHVELNSSNGVKDGWLRDVAKKVLVQGENCDSTDLVEWWL